MNKPPQFTHPVVVDEILSYQWRYGIGIDYVLNVLGIPACFYVMTAVIGAVVWVWKGWRRGLLAAYLFFVLAETVLIREPGVLRYELMPFWSWGREDLRLEIITNIYRVKIIDIAWRRIRKGGGLIVQS